MATMTVCMAGQTVMATGFKAAKAAPKEEKNFFQFLSDALDKNSLSETDPVLAKVAESAKPGKTAAPAKKLSFPGFGKK